MAAVIPMQRASVQLVIQQRCVAGCSQRLSHPLPVCRALRPQQRRCRQVWVAAEAIEAEKESEEEKEPEFEDTDDGPGLTTHQVESFLQTLCEDTEIAEVDLKMGSFSMKVRRSISGGVGGSASNGTMPPSPPASPTATQSLDMAQFQPLSPTATQSTTSLDEEDESENLVNVESPKVGVLRRGKYVRGKKIGKGNVVEEGDTIKKGQHVAYVEQLGTFVPVEAPQAGELVNFIVEDGNPVEYGEVVVELAPFFGGHIIGDRKHA